MASTIPTSFLVLSDTHGDVFEVPTRRFDVALHCGDLTEESKLDEYKVSLELLKKINAPLKLVIAGNHDFTLDTPTFRRNVAGIRQVIEPDLIRRTYGDFGEAKALLESDGAKAAGIVYLEEGTHHFTLANGASLTVYASPFTASLSSGWGFNFHPSQDHEWSIGKDVDIVMTHGPPLGVLDYTDSKVRAGSSSLFRAVARAQPRLHCFGHIHEGWGARRVAWRSGLDHDSLSHFTAIDNDRSETNDNLARLYPHKFDDNATLQAKASRLAELQRHRYRPAMDYGATPDETMFVNASLQGELQHPTHLAWEAIIHLPGEKSL